MVAKKINPCPSSLAVSLIFLAVRFTYVIIIQVDLGYLNNPG